MFSVGFSELLLILVIAYVFVGPQDLPKVTRWLAHALRRTRRLIAELKQETGWEQFLNDTQDIKRTLTENDRDIQKSLRAINQEVNEATQELEKNISEVKQETFKK